MYNLNIDKKLLDEQIRKLLESNLDEDTKEGLHNLLGEIYDQSKSVRDILYWIDAGIDELNQATCAGTWKKARERFEAEKFN